MKGKLLLRTDSMNFAIIVAAGKGARMGKNSNKVFLPLLHKPMIWHVLSVFHKCREIDGITVVTQKDDSKKINEIKNSYSFNKIKKIVEGGKERQDSVYNGLMSIKAKDDDIILIHNGSNPLVLESEIVECIHAAMKFGAAVSGFPLKDTIKKTSNNFVEKTIDRKGVFQVQTPQAVRYGLFIEAFKNAKRKKLEATDDVSLVEALGRKVKIAQCSYENIKVTTQDDLKIAEGILMGRNKMNAGFKVGFGHDSHRFSASRGRKLVLGGYTVPNEIGLEANSDGDLILHALFNAVSSAIGLKSLGHYADPMLEKGITDSGKYLQVILNKLKEKNMEISSVSISIEAKRPRLDDCADKIIESLSRILAIGRETIGITFTSGEGLTPFGKGEGMQCFAVVSLK